MGYSFRWVPLPWPLEPLGCGKVFFFKSHFTPSDATISVQSPKPTDPLFSEKMAELGMIIQKLMEAEQAKRTQKVHANLVREVRLKSTNAKPSTPNANEAIHFLDPATPGQIAIDVERAAEIASDCLRNLGGDPQFPPDPQTLATRLSHLPQCPPATRDIPTKHLHCQTIGSPPKHGRGI